jgi:hypothetical protein
MQRLAEGAVQADLARTYRVPQPTISRGGAEPSRARRDRPVTRGKR